MEQYDHYSATPSPHCSAASTAVSASSPVAEKAPQSPTSATNAPVVRAISGVELYSAQWRRPDPKRQGAAHASSAPGGANVAVHPVSGIAAAATTATKGKARKLTEEEKVEKHRMIVRRSYYQKKELKARLKQDIERLEKQYNTLMKITEAAPSAAAHGGNHGMHTPDLLVCTCCESIPCVRTLYRELSVQKELLRKQNDALEEQILQHLTFHDKIAFIAARQLDKGLVVYPSTTPARSGSSGTPPLAKRSAAAAPTRITVETPDCCLSFEPLAETECFATIRDAQHAIVSQHHAPASLREVGLPVLGWNRKRTFGTAPQFSLRKRFHSASSVELVARTWRAYTESSDAFTHLYSGTMNMRVQLLQRVNENNVLFHRSLQTDVQQTRCMTFFQLSRVQVEQRHFIIFCSIQPERVLPELTDRFNWLDMFTWLCFTDVEDADGTTRCEIELGGNIPSQALGDADFWMMEFLSYVLRFENRFVRPVFHVDL